MRAKQAVAGMPGIFVGRLKRDQLPTRYQSPETPSMDEEQIDISRPTVIRTHLLEAKDFGFMKLRDPKETALKFIQI